MIEDDESRLFSALADPQRRRMLRQLGSGPSPVHALARDARVSRSAVSQHLGILRDAGLVTAERRGREMLYHRSDQALGPVREWIGNFRDLQLSRTVQGPGTVPLHISAVAVPVLDHDRARRFYESVLGFALVTDRTVEGWRWVSLLPPGGSCAIGLVRAPAAGIWTGVSLLTSDARQTFERWHAQGVSFQGPPARQPWGATTAIFADIDGNRFQLVEVPPG